MPGCAAVGCNNRSEKGYIMKCFPRDPKLRKLWQERVARADWEPSNNSFLCHVHFKPEEWSITQSGRIRLKRDAVPTIFTVTSTRKSPKKRIKLSNMKNEKECENDYIPEYLENDTEHSSTGNLEEKDSDDSQDLDDPSALFIYRRANQSPTKSENKQVSSKQYRDIIGNLQQESIILISKDNNIEMENNIDTAMDYGEKQMENNSTQNQHKNVAGRGISEIDEILLDDSYDEIEEKLKQICNGYREENSSNNVEKLNSISTNQKSTSEQSAMRVPFHKNINDSSNNTIGSVSTDAKNVEIIFGSESGEECVRVSECTSNNVANENDKLNQHDIDIDNITDKQNDKICLKETEEYFNRAHSHVKSNMRAAMKRKWRTREEIMKSVEKSIQTASSQDTIFSSNSDTSDNNIMEVEDNIKMELNSSESMHFSKEDATRGKFTIKVTGEREDVNDIMEDLFKDTKHFTIQEHNGTHGAYEGNQTLVTSVITMIDSDCTRVKTNAKNDRNCDILQSSIIDIKSRSNDHVSYDLETLKNNERLGTRLIPSHFNEESNDIDTNSECSLDINNITEQTTTTDAIEYDYQKLWRKLKMQENAIRKLTNQLILYKDIEKDLKRKNFELEIKTMCGYDAKTDNELSPTSKKNMDSKESTLFNNLSNRINYFVDMNEKLMRTITMECQEKRELESQIKQKDNRIKELNWKLQKASKFYDRAAKNANTCKKKMLNMQTFLRRRKLLQEKLSQFNEMLIDHVTGDYSERAQAMAMEIKNVCGEDGYNKLLSFGFPLPALSSLQISLCDNSSDSNESSNEITTALSSKHNAGEEHVECGEVHMKNGIRADSNSPAEISKTKEIVLDSTETVTGTVQDIFEENNDMDDFTTTELREHFILELNVTM